jgi:hypothetical protein
MDDNQVATALCIWEAMLERRENNPQMDRYWNDFGTVMMRQCVIKLTPIAERVWAQLSEDEQDGIAAPFDWSFIPAFVDHVYWDGTMVPHVEDEATLGVRIVKYIGMGSL